MKIGFYGAQNPAMFLGPGMFMTGTVKIIIALNVAFFVLTLLFPGLPWAPTLGLVPAKVFGRLMLWQPFTYMFLHGGTWHLLMNMLTLWFFGPSLESVWGRRRFLFFYFFSGIGAALCSYALTFRSLIPVVGASGAIYGILVAYAILFPETRVLIFFVFPMNIRPAVLIFAAMNLLGALSAPGSGIAYFAHLGGGLFGWIYLKFEPFLQFLIYPPRLNPAGWLRRRREAGARARQQRLDRQVDAVLDKIARQGINSLTGKEQKILEKKSGRDSIPRRTGDDR